MFKINDYVLIKTGLRRGTVGIVRTIRDPKDVVFTDTIHRRYYDVLRVDGITMTYAESNLEISTGMRE